MSKDKLIGYTIDYNCWGQPVIKWEPRRRRQKDAKANKLLDESSSTTNAIHSNNILDSNINTLCNNTRVKRKRRPNEKTIINSWFKLYSDANGSDSSAM